MTEPAVQPLAPSTTKDHPITLFDDIFYRWTGTPPSRTGANNPNADTCRWEWDSKLSPQEEGAFDELVNAVKRGFDVTAEYTARKSDLALCVDFLNVQNPTTAQNAAVLKAVIRVLQDRFRID